MAAVLQVYMHSGGSQSAGWSPTCFHCFQRVCRKSRPHEDNLQQIQYVITSLLSRDMANDRKYTLFVSGVKTNLERFDRC